MLKKYPLLSHIEAKNGQEALDLLYANNIDIVLMDIRMPVMDGFEATRKIRQQDKYKNLPIFAITASVLEDDLRDVKKKGFDAFVHKPLLYKEFMQLLSRYLKADIIIEDMQTNDDINLVLDEDIKVKYKELFYEELLNQEKRNNFKTISILASDISLFADDNKIVFLKDIAQELIVAVDLFDIEMISDILKKLQELCEEG